MAARYRIDQSPIYMCSSRSKLCGLLRIRPADLDFLLNQVNYLVWDQPQKAVEKLAGFNPKKRRLIEEPKPVLRAVLQRLRTQLSKIEVPDYLFSAVRGRSYASNALCHRHGVQAVRIDVRSFYPSVKQSTVKAFFRDQLKCAHDISTLLARLCCLDGHLPTGSPVSPILCFLACSKMFQRFLALAEENDLKFTLYVDDMVFSGARANRAFAVSVTQELRKHGLRGHKLAHFPEGHWKVITGVAVTTDRSAVPHQRQDRMRRLERAFYNSRDPADSIVLGKSLIGQYREAERVHQGMAARAKPIAEKLSVLTRLPVARKKVRTRRRGNLLSAEQVEAAISELRSKSKVATASTKGDGGN